MPDTAPHWITFANEKGGTGKSTTAVHVAVALAYRGANVVAFDLDHRQRTMHRYFENRAETASRRGVELPTATCFTIDNMDDEAFGAFVRKTVRGPILFWSIHRAVMIRWPAMPRRRLIRWSRR